MVSFDPSINNNSVDQPPPLEQQKELPTDKKAKGAFDSFKKNVQKFGSSAKSLAGRVKDTIIDNKRIALIIVGIAILILGIALVPVTLGLSAPILGGIAGGIISYNAVMLYLEKKGVQGMGLFD